MTRDELAAQFLSALLGNGELIKDPARSGVWRGDAVALVPVAFQLADLFLYRAEQTRPTCRPKETAACA